MSSISLNVYTKSSLVLYGDTKDYKVSLKNMGGRYNPRLSVGAGWIFQSKQFNNCIVQLLNDQKIPFQDLRNKIIDIPVISNIISDVVLAPIEPEVIIDIIPEDIKPQSLIPDDILFFMMGMKDKMDLLEKNHKIEIDILQESIRKLTIRSSKMSNDLRLLKTNSKE
jgi:hypothetical protein